MAPPFYADHVGSFLRPKELLDVVNNPKSATEIETATSKAIKNAVDLQLQHDIRPITSGEYERQIFYGGFFEAVPGFTVKKLPYEHFRPGFPTIEIYMKAFGMTLREAPIATSKIQHPRDSNEGKSPYLKDWLYLKSLVPADKVKECKMTLISPVMHHMALKDGEAYEPGVYSSDTEFLADLVAAWRAEILTLYDAGLRFLQIDDPNLSFFCDESWRARYAEALKQPDMAGQKELDVLFDEYIAVHNAMLKGLPVDLQVGIHVCRGNMPDSNFAASGGYERIAQELFNEIDYKIFYLEFDSPRAGGLEPLRFLPKDKSVILGLVTTKAPELESKDVLKEKIYEAAALIAKSQGRPEAEALKECLGLSPQCGFSSAARAGGKGVTDAVMWEKLRLVRDVAKEVWG